jgi:hypothetical protein
MSASLRPLSACTLPFEAHLDELRVPVQRAKVEVHTEVDCRAAVLFLVPGTSPAMVFEDDAPFFPVEDGGKVRLVRRAAVVMLVLDVEDAVPEWVAQLGVGQHARWIAVHLRCGKVVTGALMAFSKTARTLDLVNERVKSLALHGDGKIQYVAKSHIVRIEELS